MKLYFGLLLWILTTTALIAADPAQPTDKEIQEFWKSLESSIVQGNDTFAVNHLDEKCVITLDNDDFTEAQRKVVKTRKEFGEWLKGFAPDAGEPPRKTTITLTPITARYSVNNTEPRVVGWMTAKMVFVSEKGVIVRMIFAAQFRYDGKKLIAYYFDRRGEHAEQNVIE